MNKRPKDTSPTIAKDYQRGFEPTDDKKRTTGLGHQGSKPLEKEVRQREIHSSFSIGDNHQND